MQNELTQEQVIDLAKPFIGMAQTIRDFFKDPAHEKAYREWYARKYGKEPPKDEV